MKKIKKFDNFGKSINLKIDGKDAYQTILGGLLNIFVLFIFFSHLSFSFNKFFENDPSISYSQNFNPEKTINLTSNQFLFAISLYNYVNFSSLNISEYLDIYSGYRSKQNETNFDFKFKPCNELKYNTSFYTEKLGKLLYCPYLEEEKNFTLNLNENQESILYLKVFTNTSIEYKRNITKALENDSKLLTIKIHYNLNLFDPENYNKPIRPHLIDTSTVLSKSKQSFIHLMYETLTVESIYMKLLDFKFFNDSIGIRQVKSDIKIVKREKEIRDYLKAVFYPNLVNVKYQREYKSIFELIGDASVITSWVSFCLSFLYSYYCDFKYKSFLFRKLTINNIDDIDSTDVNLKKNNLKEMKFFTNENLSGIRMSDIGFIKDKEKEEAESEEKEKEKEKEKNDLSSEINPNFKSKNDDDNIYDEESRKNSLDDSNSKENNSYSINDNYFIDEKSKENMVENLEDNNSKISIDKNSCAKNSDTLEKFIFKKKKVEISFLGYLFSCGKRRNKYRALNEFYDKFEEKTDIFFYFKKIKNLDLMKKLYLNNEQIKVMDILSEKYLFKFKEERKSKDLIGVDSQNIRSSLLNLDSKIDINKKLIEKIFKKPFDTIKEVNEEERE
jgi:hypothetical protein